MYFCLLVHRNFPHYFLQAKEALAWLSNGQTKKTTHFRDYWNLAKHERMLQGFCIWF